MRISSVLGGADTFRRLLSQLFREDSLPFCLIGLRFPLLDGQLCVTVSTTRLLDEVRQDIYDKWVQMIADMVLNRKRGKPFERVGHVVLFEDSCVGCDDVVFSGFVERVSSEINSGHALGFRGVLVISPENTFALFHPGTMKGYTLDTYSREFRTTLFGLEQLVSNWDLQGLESEA